MPSKPILKSQRIDNLTEWFSEFAQDFDRLLPSCYRFTGTLPTTDKRARQWARTDQLVILLRESLGELATILRTHTMPHIYSEGPEADGVEVADKPIKSQPKRYGYCVSSKRVSAKS